MWRIERMREEEIDEVARLEAAAFAKRGEGGSGDAAEGDAAESPFAAQAARLREEHVRPWARIWVVRDPSMPVMNPADASSRVILGFVLVWHVVDEVHVLDVAAHVDHRRRGIGRALMDHVARFAAEQKARHVLLEVRRSNRAAIAMYRALRYYAFGLRRRYYADGEDAIEMMLALDPDTGAIVDHEDEVQLEDA